MTQTPFFPTFTKWSAPANSAKRESGFAHVRRSLWECAAFFMERAPLHASAAFARQPPANVSPPMRTRRRIWTQTYPSILTRRLLYERAPHKISPSARNSARTAEGVRMCEHACRKLYLFAQSPDAQLPALQSPDAKSVAAPPDKFRIYRGSRIKQDNPIRSPTRSL